MKKKGGEKGTGARGRANNAITWGGGGTGGGGGVGGGGGGVGGRESWENYTFESKQTIGGFLEIVHLQEPGCWE